MSKSILITGGAGFIGAHLADSLLRHGLRVRVLDNLSPQDLAGETGAEVRVFDHTPMGFFQSVYERETSII